MAEAKLKNDTKTSVEGRELIVTRIFHAPRELVFKAWTDPEHVPQWWGPSGFTITTKEIEIKPGGVWHYVMHGPDGTDYDNKITFREIESPERLVYSHGDSKEEHFQVTVTFADQGTKTELTMKMRFNSAEELERTVKEFGAIEGAQSTLGRLENQLPKITYTRAEHTDLIVERIFDAPKSLVFEAFSKAEHLERWFGVEGWTLPVCNIDFRPGGVWHYCMQSPDGKIKSWGKAVYQEIVEPEQIVYVDYFSDEEGNIAEEMPAAQITMTFEEQEGKTLLLSRTRYDSPENLKKVIDMGVIAGITQTWNRLAQFLGELK
ncbi:uncharacterized protein YndB with AHSA1/START domain [Bacillus oleivorans]|uniref:Uncharacterized protein YndB with AHSA1/START domain n=1 Tax=Bacillus oleivorans TaxID=1448271 RepID=A0A285CV85_9BACI|nr:uncharacterized protein YndB with AHSA1/START domain [Bacillus oleivorans]